MTVWAAYALPFEAACDNRARDRRSWLLSRDASMAGHAGLQQHCTHAARDASDAVSRPERNRERRKYGQAIGSCRGAVDPSHGVLGRQGSWRQNEAEGYYITHIPPFEPDGHHNRILVRAEKAGYNPQETDLAIAEDTELNFALAPMQP